MTTSAGNKAGPQRPDVFVSYSRKDREFVKRLEAALQARGREAWVDWEGIRPAEEFMQAIFPAIEGTDTFVFVISPDSVTSDVCGKELAHAAAHNKRMVPIIAREVDAKTVPEPLAKLNWVFFCRENDSFDVGIESLISGLDTDLDWVHAHTRLLTRAIEWEAKGKGNSFVLRGEDLRAAEKWLAQAGSDKERQPTALQIEYIIAGRKAASRRQRIMFGATTTGLVVASSLAIVWLLARERAEGETEAKQRTLTQSFVRAIGVSEDKDALPADETAALWELAELNAANEVVRGQVIDDWLVSEDTLQRAVRREGQGLHAAIGLNGPLRKQFTLKSEELATRLANRLENLRETDSERLSRLGSALAELAGRMDAAAVAPLAERLAKRLEDPQETDSNRLSTFGSVLPTLTGRIDAAAVMLLAERLAKRLEDPKETDSSRLSYLGSVFAALTRQMDVAATAPLAARGTQAMIKRLENPQGFMAFRLLSLASAVAELAGRMDAAAVSPLAERLANRLEDPQEVDADRLSSLGRALAALAGRMDATAAALVATRGAQALVKRMEDLPREADSDHLSSLGRALAALAEPIDAITAAALAARGSQPLVKRLENPQETTSFRLRSLGSVIAELARRMDAAAVAPLAERLAQRLEDPQETDPTRLSTLGGVFGALAKRMDAAAAAPLAERLAQRLEGPQETKSERLLSLGRALAALAERMDAIAAARLATRGAQPFIKRLEDPRQTADAVRLRSMGDLLAALAGRMDAAEVAPLAERLAKRLEHPQEINVSPPSIKLAGGGYVAINFSRLSELGSIFAALTKRMDATAAGALAARVAQALVKGMEDSQEKDPVRLSNLGIALAELARRMDSAAVAPLAESLVKRLEDPQETNFSRLSSLGRALAALAGRMDASAAATVAARGAQALVKRLEDRTQTDSDDLPSLGSALAELAKRLPPTRQIHLVALSNMLLTKISTPPPEGTGEDADRKRLSASYAMLSQDDLGTVLKWPFCVGEAQKLALAEMEKKTGQKFGGDLWKFVELAPSLGIKEVEAPSRRPSVAEAREELKRLEASIATSSAESDRGTR